ncbi:MAG TPA: SGNH/GDSL hydrolase family protein [Nitrospira sp.]
MPKHLRLLYLWSVRFSCVLILFAGLIAACGSEADTAPVASQPPQPAPQRSSATVKIMPLGDSITESTKGRHSYRYYLWHMLLEHGYHVDFVGSQYGVGNGPPADPDFDMNHEGHSGWRADEILNQIQAWATATSPDVVLLHIGTNDVCQNQSVGSTVSDIGGIIDVLRTVNPRIRVLVAQLINSSECPPSVLNAKLPALISDKDQAKSPIGLVDQYTGFDPATMTYDGIHPNDIGDSRMANRWFEKLAPMLELPDTDGSTEGSDHVVKLTPPRPLLIMRQPPFCLSDQPYASLAQGSSHQSIAPAVQGPEARLCHGAGRGSAQS